MSQLSMPDASQHELVRETVRLMWVPCAYTTLTTAVAFGSLVEPDVYCRNAKSSDEICGSAQSSSCDSSRSVISHSS